MGHLVSSVKYETFYCYMNTVLTSYIKWHLYWNKNIVLPHRGVCWVSWIHFSFNPMCSSRLASVNKKISDNLIQKSAFILFTEILLLYALKISTFKLYLFFFSCNFFPILSYIVVIFYSVMTHLFLNYSKTEQLNDVSKISLIIYYFLIWHLADVIYIQIWRNILMKTGAYYFFCMIGH